MYYMLGIKYLMLSSLVHCSAQTSSGQSDVEVWNLALPRQADCIEADIQWTSSAISLWLPCRIVIRILSRWPKINICPIYRLYLSSDNTIGYCFNTPLRAKKVLWSIQVNVDIVVWSTGTSTGDVLETTHVTHSGPFRRENIEARFRAKQYVPGEFTYCTCSQQCQSINISSWWYIVLWLAHKLTWTITHIPLLM